MAVRGEKTIADSTIKERFDNQSNGSIPDGDARLWGIPRNALRVLTYSYDHQDDLARIPTEITPDILKTYFTSGGSPRTDAPTLLFAREEHYRSASLDMADGVITISGSQVTVNMASDKRSLDTLVSLNWGPYRYQNSAWEAYPLDEYWDKMAVGYKEIFHQNPPKDENGHPMYSASVPDEEVVDGLVAASRAFYISMVQGGSEVVASDYVALITAKIRGGVIDADLAQATIGSVGAGLELIANQVAGDFISVTRLKSYQPFLDDLKRIEDTVERTTGSKAAKLKAIAKMQKGAEAKFSKGVRANNLKMAAKAGLAATALGLSIAASYSKEPVLKCITYGVAVAVEVIGAVETVKAISNTYKAARAMGATVKFWSSNTFRAVGKEIHGASMKAGVVLTVIAIAVTVGLFIAQWAMGSIDTFGSLQFNAALAGMIAISIATVILFAISLIPIVGQIIAAVIAVIDAVVNLICAIVDAVTDENEEFLFSVDLRYQADLDNGALSYDFRQEFTSRDISLSHDLAIETKDAGSKWKITDNGAGETYIPGVASDSTILSYESKVREPGAPVMLLRFEEIAGATAFSDVSGDINNGTCEGDGCPTAGHTGRYGNALVFDGVDDVVSVKSSDTLANRSFTVAFWAKRSAANRWDIAIGQGTSSNNQGLSIGFRDNNWFTCAFYGNDLNTAATYTDSDWHHWACTYYAASRTQTIYRDGANVAQRTASAHYQGTGELWAGKAPWGAHFGGRLDEVALFANALSQDESETTVSRLRKRVYWEGAG